MHRPVKMIQKHKDYHNKENKKPKDQQIKLDNNYIVDFSLIGHSCYDLIYKW